MKRKIKLLLLILTVPIFVQAQKDTYCREILNRALDSLAANKIQQAITELNKADLCDYKNLILEDRRRLQDSIFAKITEQKNDAISKKDEALILQKKADDAMLKAQKLSDQLRNEKKILSKAKDSIEVLKNQDAIRNISLQEQVDRAFGYQLIWKAQTIKNSDPTLALHLTEESYIKTADPQIEKEANDIFNHNLFYKIIARLVYKQDPEK